jgi:hypothetical protein
MASHPRTVSRNLDDYIDASLMDDLRKQGFFAAIEKKYGRSESPEYAGLIHNSIRLFPRKRESRLLQSEPVSHVLGPHFRGDERIMRPAAPVR